MVRVNVVMTILPLLTYRLGLFCLTEGKPMVFFIGVHSLFSYLSEIQTDKKSLRVLVRIKSEFSPD